MLSKACHIAAYRLKLVEMAARGIELTLVAPPEWRGVPFEPGFDDGYRTVLSRPRFNGSFHTHYYPELPRILAETRPDLLHCDEEPYDTVSYMALRAARRAGVPLLFFTWQNLRRRWPPPFKWFERSLLIGAAGGIAGNREAGAILKAKGFRKPLATIPQFGVDPSLFPPRERMRGAGEPFAIGYVGRLTRDKGLDILLDALAALSGDWRLTMVGEGPFRPTLEARAASFGARVRLAGAVPSTEIPALLRTFDVLVLPSRTLPNWKEQFGRVLVEAMASRVPVVGSDSGEIPEVIGDAGLVTPEGDAPALTAALTRLLSDPALAADLAERGRQRALAYFTHARVAEQTVAFYPEVLASR
jgi:glycosyltransferase involved in cell wall biosynthesis